MSDVHFHSVTPTSVSFMHANGAICVGCDGCFGWFREGQGFDADAVCMLEHDVQPGRTFTKTEHSTIATEAQSAVYGERGKDYGHPRENFENTARLWSALLHDKLTEPVSAEDVARCMIGVKLARDLHHPKRDNRVDIIGYAITLDRLETGN